MGAPRKKLIVDEEVFFLAVQLVCGPPKPEYFQYVVATGHGYFQRGIGPWCHHTKKGRQFTHCVTSYGEAKTRAYRWYIKYARWWRKQHGLEGQFLSSI